ncbi:MAG: hypothetical protein NTX82_04095 [Candidatus Parcubacteria bacterium]|nr:hypothetical protein [Candidatus Parcubacteria bacterium]
MDNDIKNFLEELYQLDPDLKNHEADLVKIISTMLQNKPDTKFDEQFKQRLRTELLAKIEELKKNKVKTGFWQNLKLWQGLSVASIAAVITLVVLLPSISRKLAQTEQARESGVMGLEANVSQVSDNAFGDLAPESAGLAAPSPSAGIGSKMLSGLTSSLAPSGFGGGAATMDTKMIAPDFELISYKFIYEGEEIKLADSELPVLKRIKGYGTQDYSSWLKTLNLGLIDATKFANLKVQHLGLAEDKDYGYIIDITPFEGSLNITENSQRWSYDYTNMSKLTLADIPADSELIALADEFLNKYKINLKSYDQPEVDNLWRTSYGQTVNKDEAYIPEIISIRYPLLVDNKTVFDQNGYKTGIFVNINVRKKMVSGVYSIFTQNYTSSKYAAETNGQRIKEIAENGGLSGGQSFAEAQKTVEITLGTPTMQLMQYWQLEGNQNNELLAPAYVFPVENVSGGDYSGKYVVVPLIKDILDSTDSSRGIGGIPMPLTQPK